MIEIAELTLELNKLRERVTMLERTVIRLRHTGDMHLQSLAKLMLGLEKLRARVEKLK